MTQEPIRNVMQALIDLRREFLRCNITPPHITFDDRGDALNLLFEVERISGAAVRATPRPTDPSTTYQAGQLMGFEIRYKE
jgi:hypothetical protein